MFGLTWDIDSRDYRDAFVYLFAARNWTVASSLPSIEAWASIRPTHVRQLIEPIYLLVNSCCNTSLAMATSSRHPSPSPSLAPSLVASSYDIWTPFDCLPSQISNSRKRPSLAQLQRLQTAFDTSRYITKEERNALGHEIGLYVV